MDTLNHNPPEVMELIAWLRDEGIVVLPDDCGAEEDLFAAGLDSMAVMQLLVAAGEKFGAALRPGDLTRENLGTPRALAALIGQRRCAVAEGGGIG